jgi:hypothetical protein
MSRTVEDQSVRPVGRSSVRMSLKSLKPRLPGLVQLRKIIDRGISNHGEILKNTLGRRLLRDERQLQVINDPVHDGILRQESNNLHPIPALGAFHRIDLVDLADHLGPAFRRDRPQLFPNHAQCRVAALPGFPPVSVGIETVVTNHDLPLIGDMGRP